MSRDSPMIHNGQPLRIYCADIPDGVPYWLDGPTLLVPRDCGLEYVARVLIDIEEREEFIG